MTAAIPASEARKRLFVLLRQVNKDHSPVEIVYAGGNAVLVAKEDWDAMVDQSRDDNGEQLRRPIRYVGPGRGARASLPE